MGVLIALCCHHQCVLQGGGTRECWSCCAVITSVFCRVAGVLIALCCHHQCRWQAYVGKEFMRQCGITAADFSLLTRLSSWAVCGWRDRDGSFGESISPLFQQAWDCGSDCSLKSFLTYCNCRAEVAAVWGPLKSFLTCCNCRVRPCLKCQEPVKEAFFIFLLHILILILCWFF